MRDRGQQEEDNLKAPRLLGRESSGDVTKLPNILSFVADKANLVTLLGLSCGLLAIFFALNQNFPAAIIAMLWAVLFDWYDGLVARSMPDRSESQKLFGGYMDSLVDMVTSATGPAILLLSVGDFSPWFYPGALAIVVAGVLRLAYFDVYGLDENGAHAGITIDNTPFAISAVFLLHTIINSDIFAGILYATILVMAYLHVAPFRMGKLGGRWNYAVTAYVVVLSIAYAFIIWTE